MENAQLIDHVINKTNDQSFSPLNIEDLNALLVQGVTVKDRAKQRGVHKNTISKTWSLFREACLDLGVRPPKLPRAKAEATAS